MSDNPAVPSLHLENERVRVTEWRFTPGAATGWHRHEFDYVIVPVTSGTLHLDNGDSVTEAELVAGLPYFRPAGVEHDVVNAGAADLSFVEVELKQPG